MTNQDLDLNIVKLNKLIQIGKQIVVSDHQLEDITNYTINLIDKFLLENNLIAYYLNKDLKNQHHQLDIAFSEDQNQLDVNKIYQLIYLLKSLLSILLAKDAFCNLNIFTQIKANLLFYIKQSLENNLYDAKTDYFDIWDKEYHQQIIMFNHLYSNFNKMTFNVLYLNLEYNLKPINKFQNDYNFSKDFVNLSYVFYKTRGTMNRSNEFFELLDRSSIFNLLEKLKFNLDRFYLNKQENLNISIETQSLFIIICRVMLQIEFDFKDNDEINRLIELNTDI
ncbi:hypothetical protein [Mycoplasma sp. HU2014]|uniref:hypothetical protein n=1 Tax=Mycoplasma sp. HU2014 TaxID=1664275 RepID=UPI00067C615E|nr:hypothetical protein [Mycoplasma sp. HU2014]KNG79393.1 hypothetical protein AB668_02430 [Mycoplasma sp. HU2014]